MLVHPIIDKLQALRFFGMRSAYEEQLQMADIDQLNFDERLGQRHYKAHPEPQ